MRWRIGTVGFGYKEWAGVFYPKGVGASDYLAYYARCFDSVELDTTFHAMPTAERVARWAEVTPAGFRFAVKALREVTHAKDVGAMAGLFGEFVSVLRGFGEKLSVVLMQFPPDFGAGRWRELEKLVASVPQDVPLVAEFRDKSWFEAPNTAAFLRDYHITWGASDVANTNYPKVIRPTTSRLYLRMIGQHDAYPAKNREAFDATANLKGWLDQIPKEGIDEVWVLLNNDYAGYAIATADRLNALLGRPPIARPPAVETTLFG